MKSESWSLRVPYLFGGSHRASAVVYNYVWFVQHKHVVKKLKRSEKGRSTERTLPKAIRNELGAFIVLSLDTLQFDVYKTLPGKIAYSSQKVLSVNDDYSMCIFCILSYPDLHSNFVEADAHCPLARFNQPLCMANASWKRTVSVLRLMGERAIPTSNHHNVDEPYLSRNHKHIHPTASLLKLYMFGSTRRLHIKRSSSCMSFWPCCSHFHPLS